MKKKKDNDIKYKEIQNKLKEQIKNSEYFKPFYKQTEDSDIKLSWFDIKTYQYNKSKKQEENKLYNNNNLRAKQIKIYPNEEQKIKLNEWIELARLIYNLTVKYFKHNKFTSFISVRPIIKKLYPKSLLERTKASKMPEHVQDGAIRDVCKAYKSSEALKNAGYIKYFKIRYKKINKPQQCIVLEKSDYSIKSKCFYSRLLGFIKLSNDIKIEHDCRLIKNRENYILNVPYTKKCNKISNQYKECGIDPGNKTFLTLFNPEGECLKIFNRDYNKRLISKLQKRNNLKYYYNKTKLKKYNKALLNVNQKIQNLVKELHYKSAIYLCNKFDNIYLGKLNSQQIVHGKNSDKGKTSTKNQSNSYLSSFEKDYTHTLSHFKFRTILQNKCQEYNKKFYLVNEMYTSKSCGLCGQANNVGTDRIINCKYCKGSIDRDLNGARNILIKQQ